jgi:peptidoglycan/LPS O-acetylase OafA/YrhL
MFFAITAYLFVSKLLRTKEAEPGYWLKLYVGRLFRLIPVCGVATIILLVLKPSLFQSLGDISIVRSLLIMATASLFGGFGRVGDATEQKWEYLCPTGAHWTLNSEWLFYFILPIVGLAYKPTRNLFWVLSSIAILILVRRHHLRDLTIGTWPFAPGIIAAIIVHYQRHLTYFSNRTVGFISIFIIVSTPFLGTKLAYIPANALFLLVLVSDNSVTSWLKKSLLTYLGDTTFSLYILHGLVQYATLKWIVTIQIARNMPEWIWWLTCAGQVVVVVLISRLSFEYVEKPSIEAGKRFYSWLMNLIELRAKWLLNWI